MSFLSPFQSDANAIRAKLAAANARLAAAEQALREASVAAALADDPAAAVAAERQAVEEAKFAIQVLRAGLQDAENKEAARLKQAKADAWQSHVRATKQHLSRIPKEARAFETAATNMVAAFRRMVSAASSAEKLLPNGDREWNMLREMLGKIAGEVHFELNAIGCVQPGTGGIAFPGCHVPRLGFFADETPHVPLHERLAEKLIGQFDFLVGETTTPPQLPEEVPENYVEPPTPEAPPEPQMPGPSWLPDPAPPGLPAHFSDPAWIEQQKAAMRGVEEDDAEWKAANEAEHEENLA